MWSGGAPPPPSSDRNSSSHHHPAEGESMMTRSAVVDAPRSFLVLPCNGPQWLVLYVCGFACLVGTWRRTKWRTELRRTDIAAACKKIAAWRIALFVVKRGIFSGFLASIFYSLVKARRRSLDLVLRAGRGTTWGTELWWMHIDIDRYRFWTFLILILIYCTIEIKQCFNGISNEVTTSKKQNEWRRTVARGINST